MDLKERLLEKSFERIQKDGWISLNLKDVGEELSIPYADIYEAFPNKIDLLTYFSKKLDQETLQQAQETLEDLDNPREKLFEVTMARFESAAPYRAVIRIFWQEGLKDPQLIMQGFSAGMTSVNWLLSMAGLETSGWGNMVRVKLFTAAYLKTVKEWLDDPTPDLSKTMAALDYNLDKLAKLPGFF